MARDFNENRNVNARLVSADIDTLGVTFAAQSPYRADGFLKVNVTVANANPTQKMFLEGADFTIYAIGGNVNKLSAYSLSMFKKLEQVWLFSSTMVEIEETDNNAYLDYLKSSCVIYVPSNLISNYQTAYSNLSSKFAPINEDYTLAIVGSGTLESEIITDQLMNGTYNAQDRGACTKLVISGFDNYMDTLWGYNLSAVLPNLNNNIWYNANEIDFTTRELEGVDELLESDITNLINGISGDKINGVTQLKFSGFSDMSVALTYDYSDLPNLTYIWLDNVRYENVNGTIYQPIEYIESSGTQYIDSNVLISNNVGLKIKVYLDRSITEDFNFARGKEIPSQQYGVGYQNSDAAFYKGFYYAWGDTSTDRPTAPTGIYNIELNYLNDKKYKIEELNIENALPSINFTDISNIILFGRMKSDDTLYLSSSRIYECMISNNNNIISNFIPCYRKSDGEGGLYDVVTKTFFTNQGTGTFIKGSNITIDEDWWGNSTYFYPISDLVSEYDARLTQTFYLDYNGTLPSYPNYQLTYYTDINCTISILPTELVSGTRYYAKAIYLGGLDFATDTWSQIKYASENGIDNYQVGDTKDIVIDNLTYHTRIVDKSQRYKKTSDNTKYNHLVIQAYNVLPTSYTLGGKWSSNSNLKDTMNSTILATLPNDLQSVLENYDLQNEEDGALVTSSCKLFCPTSFEILGTVLTNYELEETTQYGFYVGNVSQSTTYLKTPNNTEVASGQWATRTNQCVINGYYSNIQSGYAYGWAVGVSIFFAL